MRVVVTRVRYARVVVDGAVAGEIGTGFLVLLGVGRGDGEADCDRLADKVCSLRLFEDEEGRINRPLEAVGGRLLVVPQFTLYANCRKGRRPDFLAAAPEDLGYALWVRFAARCRARGFAVETGVFGAHMDVESLNDGPFTIIIDSDELKSGAPVPALPLTLQPLPREE